MSWSGDKGAVPIARRFSLRVPRAIGVPVAGANNGRERCRRGKLTRALSQRAAYGQGKSGSCAIALQAEGRGFDSHRLHAGGLAEFGEFLCRNREGI